MKKQQKPDLELYYKKHRSARSIILSYFSTRNKKNIKNILSKKIKGRDFSDKLNKEITVQEFINHLNNKQKIWGYCAYSTKRDFAIIHYWYKKDSGIKLQDICTLFSHEMAHAIGIKSEEVANKYATVAGLTIVTVLQKFKKEVAKFLKLEEKKT